MAGRLGLAVAPLALALGCGYAFTAGKARMPPGAERVYVPPFANRTGDAEAGAILTGALREELERRGANGGPEAQARIEGVVQHSSFGQYTVDASSYNLILDVQVKLVVRGRVVSEQLAHRQQAYLGEVDALASEARRRVALHQAAAEVAREVVERFEKP